MAKIRKFYRKKRSSKYQMNNTRSYYFSFPLFLHSLLPLSCKSFKEDFSAVMERKVLGSVSAFVTRGVPSRIRIGDMFFAEECYDVAKQLIEYVVSFYGAKGAASFVTKINSTYPELLNILSKQYNFRQCAYEKLWKVSRRKYEGFNYNLNVRSFRNSDAASVSVMYNESLISHFRPSLSLTPASFKEPFCKGLYDVVEYRYIIEDKTNSNHIAYISISTKDEENYVLDIVQSSWYDTQFDDIIAFACAEIKKRNLNFNLFVKSKKYTVNGSSYEEFLSKNSFLLFQTNIVLVKDYYNTVNVKDDCGKFVMLGQPSY